MLDGVPEPADDAPAARTAKHRPNRLDQRDIEHFRNLSRAGAPAVTELLPRKAAPLVPSAAHGRSGCSSAGASDGIRTRVDGFAGRCLATQPHPQQPGLFHRRRPTPTDWFSVIANPTQLGGYGVGMQTLLAADPALLGGPGQSSRQIVELLIAFGLTALIGLEREVHGKSAGLRTQAIVGTASALILIVSKYGFFDVLNPGTVEVDPSRVAAQIVSGIGFLGAGLIITRQGAVHGLTTAAAIWECAAIGMAAAAGLVKLAILVTFLHFVIVLGFTPLTNRLTARLAGSARLHITYEPNRGVLGRILQVCQQHRWALSELSTDPDGGVLLTITGSGVRRAPSTVAGVDGVTSLRHLADKDD